MSKIYVLMYLEYEDSYIISCSLNLDKIKEIQRSRLDYLKNTEVYSFEEDVEYDTLGDAL